jgi:sugar porter (SP) family MFS transporter
MSTEQRSFFFVITAVIAALSGILFGYDTGVISGAILFINDQFHLTPQMNGLVVGMVLLGALMGALNSGHLTDKLGRRTLLIIDAGIFIVGTITTAVASDIQVLMLGRFIVGIAIGIASYVAPLYISEIAPLRYRGALVSCNQLAITIGIFLSYIVDYAFAASGNWRGMFLAGVIPAACLLLGMLALPESPRWMMANNHKIRALDTLKRLRNTEHDAQKEYAQIEETLKHPRGSWKVLFSKVIRPTLLIGVGLAVLQQVSGINTIIYYAPTILKLAGFESATTAILATMGVGFVFVLFTVIALPFIDRWGRRPLLFTGMIAMSLSLIYLAYAFHSHDAAFIKWMALIAMLVYIAGFAVSLGPIMWLMISEIYPLKVRGLGSSVATAANWGSNMIVAVTFLTLIEFLGPSGTFTLYFIISLLGLWFVYALVPETRGVSLEQIEDHLYQGKPCKQLGLHVK